MRRTVMMMAMAMLVSGGITRAAQEPVAAGPASPVQGGKVSKTKTMTATGSVKTVTADSLAINDGPGKDWTFVIDAKTKVILSASQDAVAAGPASPIKGGKVTPSKSHAITDLKEGERVQVKYHSVNGKMQATEVRVM